MTPDLPFVIFFYLWVGVGTIIAFGIIFVCVAATTNTRRAVDAWQHRDNLLEPDEH